FHERRRHRRVIGRQQGSDHGRVSAPQCDRGHIRRADAGPVRGPAGSSASLVTERGRAEPARLRHIEHDAVRSGPFHLNVALCARPDTEGLLDVVTAPRPRCGEPLRDRFEALHLRGMITGPVIAEIAALVGDPARATMVSSLLDGRALTASELARAAHITPQTASTHLAKLTEAGLLSAIRHGRHRHFRLASPTVVDMIDGIVAVALLKRPRYRPLSREARALSAARICYDHLAGRLSVDLTD